jgi:hypothetical protein
MRAKVRLRRVARGDFRKSEHTLFNELPVAFRRKLKGTDAVCFISGTGNQVVFVYGFTSVGMTQAIGPHKSRRYGIVTSVRLRLTGSTWNPLMLQNYADECGIELAGIKRFEDHYEKLRKEAA